MSWFILETWWYIVNVLLSCQNSTYFEFHHNEYHLSSIDKCLKHYKKKNTFSAEVPWWRHSPVALWYNLLYEGYGFLHTYRKLSAWFCSPINFSHQKILSRARRPRFWYLIYSSEVKAKWNNFLCTFVNLFVSSFVCFCLFGNLWILWWATQ